MKTKLLILMSVMVLCSSVTTMLSASEKIVAGPKGGRLLDTTPKTEFFVTPERKVEITFYDAAEKPVDPGSKVAALNAETSGGRQVVELVKTETGFVSKSALPAGVPYRVVLQLRDSPEAKPRNFRIDLDLANCAECNLQEYACTCGH